MIIDKSHIARDELRALLAFWEDQRGEGQLPRLDMMSPVDLAPYLANLMLVEVEEHSQRVRYRQVGEDLTRIYGKRVEGEYLDQMPGRFRRFAEPAYREMLEQPRPRYAKFRFVENWWIATYERLMLPLLAMDEDRVTEIIVAIYPKVVPKAGRASAGPEPTPSPGC